MDELGWNLKLSVRVWNKCVIPLLNTYAELHGEEEVPADFVIPSEAPWDEKYVGRSTGAHRGLQLAVCISQAMSITPIQQCFSLVVLKLNSVVCIFWCYVGGPEKYVVRVNKRSYYGVISFVG